VSSREDFKLVLSTATTSKRNSTRPQRQRFENVRRSLASEISGDGPAAQGRARCRIFKNLCRAKAGRTDPSSAERRRPRSLAAHKRKREMEAAVRR